MATKLSAGFDRARAVLPAPAPKPKLDLAMLQQLKAQQGIPVAYGDTGFARQMAARRAGMQDAAGTFGVPGAPLKLGSEKVANPLIGAAMTAGRAALPWLTRTALPWLGRQLGGAAVQTGTMMGANAAMNRFSQPKAPQRQMPNAIGQV